MFPESTNILVLTNIIPELESHPQFLVASMWEAG